MNVTQNDLVHNIMPKFQSRRIVRAAEITDVSGNYSLGVEVGGATYLVSVPENMFVRYQPVVGDYYFVYDDGYTSICPKASFEAGYVGSA